MGKLSNKTKGHFFSLTEIILCIVLVGMALPSIGLQGHKFLKGLRFGQDVEALCTQLQLANDLSLQCNIPVKITLKQTAKGLACKFELENKQLEKAFPTERLYSSVKEMRISKAQRKSRTFHFFCCFSGGLDNPEKISFLGPQSKKLSIIVKGYPHVLEIEK
ncbi:MAG: hypothetical protein S4CHLAM6_15740 [Chlamydiae bacterium]|nr:hypothetical protein [Chlamydiota bacterium]